MKPHQKDLDDALGRVAEAQDELLRDTSERARARAHFLASSEEPPPRRRPAVAWALAAAALLAVGLSAGGLFLRRPLQFEVLRDGVVTDAPADWLNADDRAPLELRFSDGSELTLAPGTRARVTSTTRHGARVMVAEGLARAHITPRHDADWHLVLGEFDVHVTGTRFTASWDPSTRALEVAVEEGSVGVTGPLLPSAQAVRAGHTLSVQVDRQRVVLDAPAEEPPAEPAPDQTAPTPPRLAPPPPAGTRSQGAKRAPPPPSTSPLGGAGVEPASWQALAERGEYRAALALAEGQGFMSLCATLSEEALLQLGDTARLSAQAERAGVAYQTLRRRFPGSRSAALASFALGKVDFDQRHQYRSAASWFAVAVQELGGGELGREALGRLMEASERAGDLCGARQAAATYLADFPAGPHADYARQLRATPAKDCP